MVFSSVELMDTVLEGLGVGTCVSGGIGIFVDVENGSIIGVIVLFSNSKNRVEQAPKNAPAPI